jgi:hypothetical protein
VNPFNGIERMTMEELISMVGLEPNPFNGIERCSISTRGST